MEHVRQNDIYIGRGSTKIRGVTSLQYAPVPTSLIIPKKYVYHLASFAYFGRISDPAHTYEAYPNHKALENVH